MSYALHRLVAARFAVSAVFLLNGIGIGFWAVHIPTIQWRLELDEGSLGLVLLSMAAGAMFAMPLSGATSVRFGTRRVTTICAVAFACAIPLPILASSLPLLLSSAVAFGACNGALDVAMNAHATEVERSRGRPTMSSFHGFFSVGGLVGAALGGAAVATGWDDGRGAIALVIASLLALCFAVPHLLEGDHRTPDAAHFGWPRRPAVMLGLLALLCMAVEGAVADWSALLLANFAEVSSSFAAVGYSAFSVVMAICRFAGDCIVSKIGPRSLVLLGGISIGAGFLLATTSTNVIVAPIGFALVGLGAANVVPVVFAAAGRVRGLSAGAGVATAATIGYSGFLLGPPVIGWVAEYTGLAGALGLLSTAGFLIAAGAGAIEPLRSMSPLVRGQDAKPKQRRGDAHLNGGAKWND